LLLGVFALATRNALAQEKAKVGDKAPKFEATDDQGKTWKSSDHVGKKLLVLYFYPADFTGGCTKQACGFRDEIENLNGLQVEVVGVSGDSANTHKLFKSHHKLTFTLLADEKGDIAKLFGVKAKPGGKVKGVDESGNAIEVVRGVTIPRFTVVIDRSGQIAAIDQVSDAAGDSKRVANVIKKLASK
jgi:peroxiredoxin Q/BCP